MAARIRMQLDTDGWTAVCTGCGAELPETPDDPTGQMSAVLAHGRTCTGTGS